MELASAEDAALAIRMMDGYPFDKRHKFSVNRFTDVEKLANLDEEYKEPAEEEYKDRVSDDRLTGRRHWLTWRAFRNTCDHGSPMKLAATN
jgi:hypothetical protein